jgi:hypothetical protein
MQLMQHADHHFTLPVFHSDPQQASQWAARANNSNRSMVDT